MHRLPDGETVFAGQRNDGFFADLGAIFDMEDLRRFQTLHIAPMAPTIGLGHAEKQHQRPHDRAADPDHGTSPATDPACRSGSDGADGHDRHLGGGGAAQDASAWWTSDGGNHTESGPWVQVSRLGNPLFNELLVPMVKKDGWNGSQPAGDAAFVDRVEHPEVARLLPDPVPAALFANLEAGIRSPARRARISSRSC